MRKISENGREDKKKKKRQKSFIAIFNCGSKYL